VGGGTGEVRAWHYSGAGPGDRGVAEGCASVFVRLLAELVTPTGAAIVKTLASRFAAFPEMKIEKSGYGAGSRDFPGHPNVVRLTVGETASSHLAANTASETITVLEANLDDLNPQVFGYVMDRLLEEGALDVSVCRYR
jgi:pyridinium-3,5-bisthiocarboxylic acid mononucleotide nickel chelatase